MSFAYGLFFKHCAHKLSYITALYVTEFVNYEIIDNIVLNRKVAGLCQMMRNKTRLQCTQMSSKCDTKETEI